MVLICMYNLMNPVVARGLHQEVLGFDSPSISTAMQRRDCTEQAIARSSQDGGLQMWDLGCRCSNSVVWAFHCRVVCTSPKP